MGLRSRLTYLVTGLSVTAAGVTWTLAAPVANAAVASMTDVVPIPVTVQPASGVTYTLPSSAGIAYSAGSTPAADVANYLAGILRRSTGYALPVSATSGTPTSGIGLLLGGAPATVGPQGYQLDVTAGGVLIRAQTATGLFNGVQTLRQLLPPAVEAASVQQGPWQVPGGRIVDYPRFAYRGAMLDVSRHFHPSPRSSGTSTGSPCTR